MEIIKFCTRLNVLNIPSIPSFAGIHGGINKTCKDVYFIRCIGYNHSYLSDIKNMDKLLTIREEQGQGNYTRIHELPKLVSPDDITLYSQKYELWIKNAYQELSFPSLFGNETLKNMLLCSLKTIQKEFLKVSPFASESIQKNFMIKIMYWMDEIFKPFGNGWNEHSMNKLVYDGLLKKQEYLFFYLLTLMGIDVLLLSPTGELKIEQCLLDLSKCISLDERGDICIPNYDRTVYSTPLSHTASTKESPYEGSQSVLSNDHKEKIKVNVKRPERDRKTKEHISTSTVQPSTRFPSVSSNDNSIKRELEFEQLAHLASSVVMIAVHDRGGNPFAYGSGIMLNRKGYILTNFHVIEGGCNFSVRIENEERVYQTDEVIKYNSLLDLALLRIDRVLNPIPIYQGQKPLARGQKVVAIGSPLGLFNSVSDGIISGFREFDHVSMIQFTAPISNGSSGGAVLNMYGEVIGISTAGFDNGQNINLAVHYTCIMDFARGFLSL